MLIKSDLTSDNEHLQCLHLFAAHNYELLYNETSMSLRKKLKEKV
jgi:hypothetical protein